MNASNMSLIKFGLPFLLLCTIVFLIFVNIVEKSVENAFPLRELSNEINEKKLLDLKDFEYVIRAHCNSSFLTWIVTSYAGDAAPRSALRRAYSNAELNEIGINRVFLLGLLDGAAQEKTGVIQAAIENEAERFRDIVQGNFYEAYRNLTYKHLMGLKWATESCHDARYIVKQDDDIVVNLYEILRILLSLKDTKIASHVMAGYVLRNMQPVREAANKWYVTEAEFHGNIYPDFLSGWLYVVDKNSAATLVERSRTYETYFWIDDVFVTGILRQGLDMNLTDLRAMYTTDHGFLRCCIKGKEKKLNCEFAVGPNGGDVELQVEFRHFAQFCQSHCARRPTKLSVGKTCVVPYESSSNLQKGTAKIDPIQFV